MALEITVLRAPALIRKAEGSTLAGHQEVFWVIPDIMWYHRVRRWGLEA